MRFIKQHSYALRQVSDAFWCKIAASHTFHVDEYTIPFNIHTCSYNVARIPLRGCSLLWTRGPDVEDFQQSSSSGNLMLHYFKIW